MLSHVFEFRAKHLAFRRTVGNATAKPTEDTVRQGRVWEVE